MAIVPRKLKRGRVVYYVTHRLHDRRQVWEHAGSDEAYARRREVVMLREIARGEYKGKPTTIGRDSNTVHVTRAGKHVLIVTSNGGTPITMKPLDATALARALNACAREV
jgi:hypothetical protein